MRHVATAAATHAATSTLMQYAQYWAKPTWAAIKRAPTSAPTSAAAQ
jgi:hypothetical protein